MICIQKPIWARAITCLLGMASLAQASLQYCHQDDELPMHMCVAVDAHYNRSSQATDVLATFGYQVVHRGGWTSVGLGSSMYGALVVIGLVNAQGKPTLEIRRATGHLEPQSSSHLPPWTVPSLAVNASGWFESSFRIYGCDSWLAVQGQDKSVQPFIWATYLGEEVHAASAAAGLGMHDEKGLFSLDLGSLVAKNGPMEASQLPVIEFGKANDHAEIDGASAGYQERRSYLFHLHGLALGLGIMVLYPAGALTLRFTRLSPFRLHVYFQLGGTLLCFVGLAAAGLAVMADLERYLHEPHVLMGLLILCGILLQNGIGWFHHRIFVKGGRNSLVTSAHVLFGRCVIILGSANALLGLVLANASRINLVFVSAVFAADVFVLLCISYVARKRDEEEKQEAEVRLLDEAEGS